MKYTINNRANSPYSKNLDIDIIPKNDVLGTFLISLTMETLGVFLKKMASTESYYQAHQSVKFFQELDWEDKEELKAAGDINEGEVAIYHEVLGDLIMKEIQFEKIVLAYAIKHLEMYKDDKELPDNWSKEVEEGIEALKKKLSIDND